MVSSHSNESNAVEVNGIRFETVMPNRTIVMPPQQVQSGTQFEAGMQLTNVTDMPQRLLLYHAQLEFHDLQGNVISKHFLGSDWYHYPRANHCRLLHPGESTVFMKQSGFYWIEDGIGAGFVEESGGTWAYSGFTLGQYTIQFVYRNDLQTQQALWNQVSRSGGLTFTEAMETWVGEVLSSPVLFHLLPFDE